MTTTTTPPDAAEPVRDCYGRLTDAGWNPLRERLKQAAAQGGPMNSEDVRMLHDVICGLEHHMDIRVMAMAYNFLVGEDGSVMGLTAGDQHYEEAKLKLDMTGWHAVDDSIDPEVLAKAGDMGWLAQWHWCLKSKPAIHEVVVTKTPGGTMAYDWLEPGRHADKGVGDLAYYAANHGEPQFWMPRDVFERVAPQWAKDQVQPLHGQPPLIPSI